MSLTMPLSEAPLNRDVVSDIVIDIGGLPIAVQTNDPEFERILWGRYRDYIRPGTTSDFARRASRQAW